MNFNTEEQGETSGFIQLFRLALYFCASVVGAMIIASAIIFLFYGMPGFGMIAQPKIGSLGPIRIIQIFSSVFFLFPALCLAWSEHKNISQFYNFRGIRLRPFLLVIAIIAVSMPLMELAISINQKMVLPDLLRGLQNWMQEKEDAAAEITKILLHVDDISDFLINLFMIAVMPAIAEELMFRGAIQRSFGKIFRSPHVAIWVTAFIFSAIHVQFFGFLPRFLLGAAFGYLYFWSGSLWYAILGHFLNNGYAVCAAWYMQKNNIPLTEADQMHFTWYGYVISFALTIMAFQIFKKQTNK